MSRLLSSIHRSHRRSAQRVAAQDASSTYRDCREQNPTRLGMKACDRNARPQRDANPCKLRETDQIRYPDNEHAKRQREA